MSSAPNMLDGLAETREVTGLLRGLGPRAKRETDGAPRPTAATPAPPPAPLAASVGTFLQGANWPNRLAPARPSQAALAPVAPGGPIGRWPLRTFLGRANWSNEDHGAVDDAAAAAFSVESAFDDFAW